MHYIYKDLTTAWKNGVYTASIPNGESALDLSNRLSSFIQDLKNRPEENVLVCSHGRALRCLICVLQGLHLGEMESYSVSNVGLYYTKQINGVFHIHLQNDTSHRTPIEKY